MAAPSILIAGAGPAGLILATILRQNGVSVRIIDKEPTHRIGSRGAGIQARTMELYDIMGILPEIQSAGGHLLHILNYKPGQNEPVGKITLAEWVEPTPGVPHPNTLALPQMRHEAILRDHLARLSTQVELGSELRGFEQYPDHVVAHIVITDTNGNVGEERTKFDWLIGTDGARSVVRKQLGLSFLGDTPSTKGMIIGDIEVLDGALDPSTWHMWSVEGKFMLFGSHGGNHKNTFMFLCNERPEQTDGQTITRDQFVEEFYDFTGRRDIKFGPTSYLTSWKPNMRVVDTMRVGRVFIAGDAAHCHPPSGGQGLNSSVQDAGNLGWKLALVHKGLAPEALLDTYGEERLRVIARMLNLTTALYKRSIASKDVATDEGSWDRGGDLRMLGVNYCGSSIIREDSAAGVNADAYKQATEGVLVRAAFRAPDAPGLVNLAEGADDTPTRLFTIFTATTHTVLLFGPGGAAQWASVVDALSRLPAGVVRLVQLYASGQRVEGRLTDSNVDLLVLADRAGHAYGVYGVSTDESTVVVVRPDGVVGAVESGPNAVDGVEQYFRKILG